MRKVVMTFGAVLLASQVWSAPAENDASDSASFLSSLKAVSQVASTVPANGDVNPYGVAIVPDSVGKLVRGSVLVSNFNNSSNLQGTGTTIVQVAPDGAVDLFSQIDPTTLPGPCPGGVGLTTALVALRSGFVVVGSLPTADGTAATASAGCLIVLDSQGTPVETLSGDPINGPWDMTARDEGDSATLFVTNVLNGTVAAGGSVVNQGTVVRISLSTEGGGMPAERGRQVIASGFGEKTDPAALVIGPTGVGLAGDTLYVADAVANRIAAIPEAFERTNDAGAGQTVSQNGALNGPLGLALAPDARILTTNGGDGNMVETTRRGTQVASRAVDVTNTGAGTLFGLALAPRAEGVYFVNDGNNTLQLLK